MANIIQKKKNLIINSIDDKMMDLDWQDQSTLSLSMINSFFFIISMSTDGSKDDHWYL